MAADEIDYQVIGDDLQAVIITLDPGEAVFAEAGAMMFMREGITMATTLDPNSKSGGLFDKLVGAGKRVLAGDSFFVTLFGNSGARRADVAFAAPYPGKIVPLNLADWGGTEMSMPRAAHRKLSFCAITVPPQSARLSGTILPG